MGESLEQAEVEKMALAEMVLRVLVVEARQKAALEPLMEEREPLVPMAVELVDLA